MLQRNFLIGFNNGFSQVIKAETRLDAECQAGDMASEMQTSIFGIEELSAIDVEDK